jgi:hypothetical protein
MGVAVEGETARRCGGTAGVRKASRVANHLPADPGRAVPKTVLVAAKLTDVEAPTASVGILPEVLNRLTGGPRRVPGGFGTALAKTSL